MSEIPEEYKGLCWEEILNSIEEAAEEAWQAEKAQREIPQRWQ